RVVQFRLPIAGGNLFDADGDLHVLRTSQPQSERLFLIPPEKQRRICAAKPKRVRQRIFDWHCALLVRNVVEITMLVGLVKVDRGRRNLMVDGERRYAGLEAA